MKKVTILSIKEPPKPKRAGYYSQWDIWVVRIQDPKTKVEYESYKSRDEYKAFIAEQRLLEQGVDPELLEEYREAVYELGNEAGYESGYSSAGGDLG